MDVKHTVDFKFIENYFKDKLLRPFARRLKYIYLGLNHDVNTLIFSDTEDTDFKYCESMQTTGLVKITNPEHAIKISQWFDYYQIDRSMPYIFYFSKITMYLNKISWNGSNVCITKTSDGHIVMEVPGSENIVIARPIDTYFTLTKLQNYVDKYTKVFFEDACYYYDVIPEETKSGSIITMTISCLDLREAGLLEMECDDIKLILLPGLDLLISKSLISSGVDYRYGVRLWADSSKHCINYGSFYVDSDVSICTCRDNIFIFPIAKKGIA